MSPEIAFLAKGLGLYLVVIALAMLANPRRTRDTFAQMIRSAPAMLLAGALASAVGLALVLGHPVGRGGALGLAVTATGWAALAKGLWLLFCPPKATAAIYRALGFERHFGLWMGAVLLLGLALTFAAFRA